MEINNFEGKKHVKILYIHPLKKNGLVIGICDTSDRPHYVALADTILLFTQSCRTHYIHQIV